MPISSRNVYTIRTVENSPKKRKVDAVREFVKMIVSDVGKEVYKERRNKEYEQLKDLIYVISGFNPEGDVPHGKLGTPEEDIIHGIDAILKLNGKIYHIDFTGSRQIFFEKIVEKRFVNSLGKHVPKIYVYIRRLSISEATYDIQLSIAFDGNTILHGEEAISYLIEDSKKSSL